MKINHFSYFCKDITEAIANVKQNYSIVDIEAKHFNDEIDIDAYYIHIADSPNIEIIKMPSRIKPGEPNMLLGHTCYVVDDIDKVTEEYLDAGAILINKDEITYVYENIHTIYLNTSDGIVRLIKNDEFIEKTKAQAVSTLTILSSFTISPIKKSLNAINQYFDLGFEIALLPEEQVFQTLLSNNPLLASTHVYIAIRFKDILQTDSDWSVFYSDIQTLCYEISRIQQENKNHIVFQLWPDDCCIENRKKYEDTITIMKDILSENSNILFVCNGFAEAHSKLKKYSDLQYEKITGLPFSQDFYSIQGYQLLRKLYGIEQPLYKVIVLDCDNTLWDGVCSEDNDVRVTNRYAYLQKFVKDLLSKGFLLGICSKNTEEDVKNIFINNPDMILTVDDITVWKVNWESKSKNIRDIAAELELGLDSFIFLDDNPVECAEVKTNCPEVLTYQLNLEENNFNDFLNSIWAFDRLNITNEDLKRTTYYRHNKLRNECKKRTVTLREFLEEIHIEIDVHESTNLEIPRISQLTSRTNQFNLSGRTYSEQELNLLRSSNKKCLAINVTDRFGSYGLVGTLICDVSQNTLHVNDFYLSCRVLGKGVEHIILSYVGYYAQSLRLEKITFTIKNTGRNLAAQKIFTDKNWKNERSQGVTTYFLTIDDAFNIDEEMDLEFEKLDDVSEQTSSISFNESLLTQISLHEKAPVFFKNTSSVCKFVDSFSLKTNKIEKKEGAVERAEIVNHLVSIFENMLMSSQFNNNSNFFTLGGTSLQAIETVLYVNRVFNTQISLGDFFQSPTINKLADIITAAIHDIKKDKIIYHSENRYEIMPLTSAQKRLWFLDELQPKTSLYNTFVAYELNGDFNADSFVYAVQKIIERHEPFRTIFIKIDGKPYQKLIPFNEVHVCVDHIKLVSSREISEYIEQQSTTPYDISKAPLLKCSIINIKKNRNILTILMPHIVNDAWSVNILNEELSSLYNSRVLHKDSKLPRLHIQYVDYAKWEIDNFSQLVDDKHADFWKKYLNDSTTIKLPQQKEESTNRLEGRYKSVKLPFKLCLKLCRLAQAEEVTMQQLFLAAWFLYLSKISGENDILVGTAYANRSQLGLEKLIGFFVNLIPFRLKVDQTCSFLEMLKQISDLSSKVYKFSDMPFEEIIRAVNPERDPFGFPLTQIMFVYQDKNYKPLQFNDCNIKRVYGENQGALMTPQNMSKFNLSLYVSESEKDIEVILEYKTAVFEEETITEYLDSFNLLLQELANSPDKSINKLTLLTKNELDKILKISTGNKSLYSYKSETLLSNIKQIVKKYPDNIAAVYDRETITYQELDLCSSRLAYKLAKEGVCRERYVVVIGTNNIEYCVAVLAVLKAGGAFIPLDIKLPLERMLYVINDSKPELVLFSSHYDNFPHHRFTKKCGSLSVNLEELKNNETEELIETKIVKNNLAYIMYTSGTTGVPKGVLIEHASVFNTINYQIKHYEYTCDDKILGFSSISFDASIWELFAALCSGATINFIDRYSTFEEIHAFMIERQISVATLTPTVLRKLNSNNLSSLRVLFSAGEACDIEILHKWGYARAFVNAYGPTEAGICASTYCYDDRVIEDLPIGKAIDNTSIYILDSDLNLLPYGAVGEICLSGVGVARGYLNNDTLSHAKFIRFNLNNSMVKIYRTGDYGYWNSRGELMYAGRRDQQVKIHGHRIELQSIENNIEQCEGVSRAIAKIIYVNEQPKIVAYIEPNYDIPAYKSFCNKLLRNWEILYDSQFSQAVNKHDYGWNSSYTGLAYKSEAMVEWIDETVAKISRLSPKNILEIGCGTALIMEKLVPICDSYVATDLSAEALLRVEEHFIKLGISKNISLYQAEARNLSKIRQNSFDTIILNSVIQYFPCESYLTDVITNLLRKLSCKNGKIFLGDVKSLAHQKLFYMKKHFCHKDKCEYSMSECIARSLAAEKELAVSPEYFYNLVDVCDELNDCEIIIKYGSSETEMNDFRYDVILYTESKQEKIPVIKKIDWQNMEGKIELLESELKEEKNNVLMSNIFNARYADLVTNSSNIDDIAKPTMLESVNLNGVEPSSLIKLAAKYNYDVKMSWAESSNSLFFDAYFFSSDGNEDCIYPVKINKYKNNESLEVSEYTNRPSHAEYYKNLIASIKAKVEDVIPIDTLPKEYIVVEKFKTTLSGKVDLKSVPAISSEKIKNVKEPINLVESQILKIWQEVLEKESIDREDNFFDLGGHSLLAVEVVEKTRSKIYKKLTVVEFFENPTIQSLSALIEKNKKIPKQQTKYKCISVMKKVEGAQNLYLIPSVSGTCFCYAGLLSHLKINRNIISLLDPVLDNVPKKFNSVKELAEYYAVEIHNYHKIGSIELLGYSFGGILSVEISEALKKMGHMVSFLGLIDSSILPSDELRIKQILADAMGSFNDHELSSRFTTQKINELEELRLHQITNYLPQQFNQKLYLYKSSAAHRANNWDAYCKSNITFHTIECRHDEILLSPYVEQLASFISQDISDNLGIQKAKLA